ncbi:PREDICTED: uncharacterized protein LOC108973238 [Bactrocera latifrons]|uniref:Uncharacterized protein n=1 Tax=Bactrocera latifrons TaxID=174628 RepID=A0A0K8VLE2_BACLA|nr:PREDICTED: uncharacterized protein LOC108973238 [Bactrocera latifrons]
MDTIIEHILNFLQFDVTSIFGKGSECGLCCMSFSTPRFSESAERCIANVYEPRPQITNGDEMMDCDGDSLDVNELQLEAFLRELEQVETEEEETETDTQGCGTGSIPLQESSNESLIESDCLLDKPKSEQQCAESDKNSLEADDECTCELVCKQVVSKIADKCSSSTMLELRSIEERANKLWEALNSNVRNNTSSKMPNWWDLKTWQKLPFYWAALSNDILCEDPFENFKRFYMGSKKASKRCAKRQVERMLILWHRLCPKQRLPFIMEAFISKVGAGKVNISDEHEIQRIICELQNK